MLLNNRNMISDLLLYHRLRTVRRGSRKVSSSGFSAAMRSSIIPPQLSFASMCVVMLGTLVRESFAVERFRHRKVP